ncbi:MAG: HAMP domain-containing sensor histidine kinase [Flavobacteriales bacterium]
MKRREKIIIVFSILILLGLILTQFLIVKNSSDIEKESIKIVGEKRDLKKENFKSQVTIALTKVRDQLISANKESSNIYLDPVKQIQENYYVVSFYDTLPKEQLKPLIDQEFGQYEITNSYQLGVYDCFTDSIIFDKFTTKQNKIPLKWPHDGYYFGVFFTDLSVPEPIKTSTLPYISLLGSLVILIAVFYLFYLARSILKQKKISDITYDFINNMTHELKTPISTISLSADVLLKSEETRKNERLNKFLSIIKTENTRLENQVERVLRIAKLDKDKIDLNFEEIDIHKVISTCLETFSVPVADRNGTISMNLKANNSIISGDIIHVTNIIYNLLDNANKYSPSSPVITVDTKNSKNEIKIVISDKGIGIKKEDCKDIFHKFYRVSTGDVHNVKGFGLGLYYVKQMMQKHNGNIEIESIVNEGSQFILTFPLQK